jgi:hypothetical protein
LEGWLETEDWVIVHKKTDALDIKTLNNRKLEISSVPPGRTTLTHSDFYINLNDVNSEESLNDIFKNRNHENLIIAIIYFR